MISPSLKHTLVKTRSIWEPKKLSFFLDREDESDWNVGTFWFALLSLYGTVEDHPGQVVWEAPLGLPRVTL